MEILYLLVPLSLVLVLVVGAVFWWSLQGGQFDDFDTPAGMIFHELEEVPDAAGKNVPPAQP